MMKQTTFLVRTAVIVAALSQLGACAMTHTQRNAGIGAAAGGALGYLIPAARSARSQARRPAAWSAPACVERSRRMSAGRS